MDFAIDRRYVVALSIKSIVGYLIGLFLVIYFLKPSDPWGFFGASLAACGFVFCYMLLPRRIWVRDGAISFTDNNASIRTQFNLADIVEVAVKGTAPYNTLTIEVKSGNRYNLHPRDIEQLANILAAR